MTYAKFREMLKEMKKFYFINLLKDSGGSLRGAARAAGMPRSSFFAAAKQYGAYHAVFPGGRSVIKMKRRADKIGGSE